MFEKIINHNFEYLSECCYLTDGDHGNAFTEKEGFSKYYGARNVTTPILNDNNVEYISEEHHFKLKKSILKPKDILISCVGANVGCAAIVPDHINVANIVRNVALIRSNNDSLTNEYLLSYFLSKYGKNLYIRLNTGNAQPLVSLDYIKVLPIYLPGNDLQVNIKNIVSKALALKSQSEKKYAEAEEYLNTILKLKYLNKDYSNFNVKNISESFNKSNRLDSEYYNVKYEKLFELINKHDCKKLHELVTVEKSIEPGSEAYKDNGIPFIRVSNISKFGLLASEIYLDELQYSNVIRPKRNTILLTKDGTVGIAYKLDKDIDVITSGAILHLNLIDSEILPDYLTLVLNSQIVKMQAERDAGGSIIQHWKPSEIEQVLIPIAKFEDQKLIADLVQNSFELKKSSEYLLETAKQAVELAIENDEFSAIEYIQKRAQ